MYKFDLSVNDIELQVQKYKNNNLSKVVYQVFMYDKYLFPYHTMETKRMSSIERLENYLKNFISKEDLLKKMDIDNELPELLKESIKFCIQTEGMNEVVAKLLLNYDEFKTRIYQMFLEASKILNQSIDDVFRYTDYNHEDQRPNRLNDAFAEVRAVISLNNLGFSNIKLLSSKKESKCVDIVTYKDNKKYVIDVAHFTDSFNNNYKERFSDVGSYSAEERFKFNIERTYQSKKEQLLISQRSEKAEMKVLLVLIDETNGFYALKTSEELEKCFQAIYSSLDFINECDLILIFNGTTYYFN